MRQSFGDSCFSRGLKINASIMTQAFESVSLRLRLRKLGFAKLACQEPMPRYSWMIEYIVKALYVHLAEAGTLHVFTGNVLSLLGDGALLVCAIICTLSH
eukprot:TRINITY_DN59140_c0_g1_i1.p2 TRINITY_DN59140_c0_g1~~TRINITY_DN59140_c0_g1_i1.p2  ORF type:complete len:100 (-),score=1.57 TRINITY_DN59140_c0_g1_i1:120-419(-)